MLGSDPFACSAAADHEHEHACTKVLRHIPTAHAGHADDTNMAFDSVNGPAEGTP